MSASTILQICVGQGRSQPLNRSVMASACRKRATRQAVDRISESKLNTVERQNTTAKSTSLFYGFLWSLLCFLWLALPCSAQSLKSYLPVLGGTDADLGLAFVNPTLVDAFVTLTLYGYNGSLLQGADILNPASVKLPAFTQKALMAAEIFGRGISGKRG